MQLKQVQKKSMKKFRFAGIQTLISVLLLQQRSAN